MATFETSRSTWTGYWRQDFLASLVVFLVALPLCMGIAIASGAPVATGLVTGIVGGLIVGFFSGAPLQVSGPAAGLTVICADVIGRFGMPALGAVVLVAGILQFVAGLLRLGQWFRAVSPAVVHGMLSGIGVLIVASQLHVMVDDRPRENGLANLISIPESIWKGLPLPELAPKPMRESRIELLQTFGDLHERQDEIARGVARTVTHHGSKELHEWEQDHLADFDAGQKQMLVDLQAAVAHAKESPPGTAENERGEHLRESMAGAIKSLEAAIADLEARRLDESEASQAQAVAALGEVLGNLKNHDWAAKVGVLSILIILGWTIIGRGKLRLIPAPLLAVLITTALAWYFALPVLYVEVPSDLINGLTFPSLTVLEDVPLRELLIASVMMAVIASAETLLCATAVDQLQNGPRTKYDRELASQGIGNMLCGMLGALPMTGVIVRSAANVQAGAKTRKSAILHGVWLLVFVLLLTPVLRMIPTASLAGILVFTGWKLIDFKGLVRLWRESRSEAAIFLITVVVIVVEDLLIGVVTGVILSAVKLLVTFSHLDTTLTLPTESDGETSGVLSLTGAATFLRLPKLAAQLDEVPPGTRLHVDFEHLSYIDHACLELLMSWARRHSATGGELVIDWQSLHERFRAEGTNGTPQATNGQSTPPRVHSDTTV